MAGKSELYRNVFLLDRKLDAFLKEKPGSAAKHKHLRLDLLRLLELGEVQPSLAKALARIYGGRSLLGRILKQVEEGEYALPKAIYDYAHWRTGLKGACLHWGCAVSDVEAVEKVASSVGRPLGHLTDSLEPFEVGCLDEVEASHERIVVYVSPRALEDMLLATVEAYLVPKSKKMRSTEVYGLCLGMVRTEGHRRRAGGNYRIRHIHVERAIVHLRARGTKDSVLPNPKSFEAHFTAAKALFPHLEVAGDFHSHPYRSVNQLRRASGWECSERDEEYNRTWLETMREEGFEPRVGFVVAIAKRKRAGQMACSPLPNVSFLGVGKNMIALGAHRILRNARYHSEGIELRIPALT